MYSQGFGHPKFERGFLPCLALIKRLLENDGLALCAAVATCRLVWWSCFYPFDTFVDTLRVLDNAGGGKEGYRIQLLLIIISQICVTGLLDTACIIEYPECVPKYVCFQRRAAFLRFSAVLGHMVRRQGRGLANGNDTRVPLPVGARRGLSLRRLWLWSKSRSIPRYRLDTRNWRYQSQPQIVSASWPARLRRYPV